jgi:hypothetical protein
MVCGSRSSQNQSVSGIDQPTRGTEAQVQQHNRFVQRRGAERTCYRKFCARCESPGPFAPHDVRSRGLRTIVEHTVLLLTVWIARWQCRKCRHVFTDYPDFRTPLQTVR